MTENKDLKYTPKTYEQFVLEEQNLTNQQDLYPELDYEDISYSKGYGPMESKKMQSDGNKCCTTEAAYVINIILNEDYVLTFSDGSLTVPSEVASGKIKGKDFSAIQKKIDKFKNGDLKVFKGKRAPRERTAECIKYEGYFEASLENSIKELKKKEDYGPTYVYNFTKP